MAKTVRYNGNTEKVLYSSNPKYLVVGKEYEVVSEIDFGLQKNYILRGVKGEFNSKWFETVKICKKTSTNIYIAISKTVPSIGEMYECLRVELVSGSPKFVRCITSQVQNVVLMGIDVYNVQTFNSLYIVKVVNAE